MEKVIYHITTKTEWQEAVQFGFYEAASLSIEGFIHCSEEHQVEGVLQRYFQGKNELVKLTINPLKLMHRLQYNYSASMNESFPHIYGRINTDAVIAVEEL
jgi:uncharacterized protein (DUF952 family)